MILSQSHSLSSKKGCNGNHFWDLAKITAGTCPGNPHRKKPWLVILRAINGHNSPCWAGQARNHKWPFSPEALSIKISCLQWGFKLQVWLELKEIVDISEVPSRSQVPPKQYFVINPPKSTRLLLDTFHESFPQLGFIQLCWTTVAHNQWFRDEGL